MIEVMNIEYKFVVLNEKGEIIIDKYIIQDREMCYKTNFFFLSFFFLII